MERITQLPQEHFIPLYMGDPVYGSAWVSSNCIIEPGEHRFFTKVKYRFPGEEIDRYQGFYQSSGHNSQNKGIWFPFDGIVARWNNNNNRIQRSWISKPMMLKSVSKCKNELVQRFGTPIFVFISKNMQRVHPIPGSSNLWEIPQKFKSIMSAMKAGNPDHTGQQTRRKASQSLDTTCFIIDEDTDHTVAVNTFIEDAISINWLYNIPATISAFSDEYDARTKIMIHKNKIDLKNLLEGNPIEIPLNERIFIDFTPILLMNDGNSLIPDYVVTGTPTGFWTGLAKKYQALIHSEKWDSDAEQQQSEEAGVTQQKPSTSVQKPSRSRKKTDEKKTGSLRRSTRRNSK